MRNQIGANDIRSEVIWQNLGDDFSISKVSKCHAEVSGLYGLVSL